MNKLYCGDNLNWLKRFESNLVDLIYLDPPFQSGKNYNMIFQTESKKRKGSTAQIQAFEDTWEWGDESEREYHGLVDGSLTREKPNPKLITLIRAMMGYLGESSTMAYLVMMAPRLVEMKRVMKETASIYLHCDPTSSHYLKLLMDSMFGAKNFRNEVVWKRYGSHSDSGGMGRVHDIILYYTKSSNCTWNQQYTPYEEEYVKSSYSFTDNKGRKFMTKPLTAESLSGGGYEYEWKGHKRIWQSPIETMKKLDALGELYYSKKNGPARGKVYLDKSLGIPLSDMWIDVKALVTKSAERLGYPTQKPEALLERIIKASSNEGDLVLDPFCGCGTTIAVSQKLGRSWMGIDITLIAIEVINKRLFERHGLRSGKDFELWVLPEDIIAEEALKKADPEGYKKWKAFVSELKPHQSTFDDLLITKVFKGGKGNAS